MTGKPILQKPVSEKSVWAWINQWRDALCLRDWELSLHTVDENLIAMPEDAGQSTAYIVASDELLEAEIGVATLRTAREVEASIAHEMGHLAISEIRAIIRSISQELAPSAAKISEVLWDEAEERLANRIARALMTTKYGEDNG